MTLGNGAISNRTSDASFYAKLTTGTSLTVSIQGTIKGNINGMPVDIIGTVKYVYAFGASAWTKSKDTLASAPDLPAGPIKFTPGPGCTGSLHVSTNGTVVNESGTYLTSAKSKDVWPLEGRTALLTLSPYDQAPVPCDQTAYTCATDCAANPACESDCSGWKANNGC